MAATASAERGIELVRTFNDEVFNGRHYDRLDDVEADDFVQHGPIAGVELHGTDAALENLTQFHAAFSDLRSEEELVFGDGEYVCAYYTYRGTHDGDFMGIPPTNESCEVRGTVINRIEDGKIAEAWVTVDLLSLMQQVGAVPAMDENTA